MKNLTLIKINRLNSIFDTLYYYEQISKCTDSLLVLDFSNASFVRNNYISILGMALEKLKKENKDIQIQPPKEIKVYNALKDVGFLPVYTNCDLGKDKFKTMIKYTNIPLKNYDEDLAMFYMYFNEQLSRRMKNVSAELLKKLIQKILEMFSNVFRHSNSELGLFCSGQFYPNNNRFNITIVDNGIGIKSSVNTYLRKEFKKNRTLGDKIFGVKYKELDSLKSIEWAIQENNSSTGRGGYGLKLLIDLINLSEGSLEIISNNGYYSIRKNRVIEKKLKNSFDGTIISIELDTDCSKYYYLKGEKNGN